MAKKATGGAASGDAPSGDKLFEADLKSNPARRDNAKKVEAEATEKKRGGRAKRKRGGKVKHLEKMEELKHAKHVGKVAGAHSTGHRGHRARGGKTGSNFNPLSSAHAGTDPPGHKTADVE